jgi:hypothetical protein
MFWQGAKWRILKNFNVQNEEFKKKLMCKMKNVITRLDNPICIYSLFSWYDLLEVFNL